MTSAPLSLPTLEEARAFGAALRPVDEKLLRQREGTRSRWWVCDERYVEVSLEEDDADTVPLAFEIGVRGRLVRFRRGRGVSTSTTEELSLSTPAPASRLEAGDGSPRADVIAVAAALLEAAPDPALRALALLLAAPATPQGGVSSSTPTR